MAKITFMPVGKTPLPNEIGRIQMRFGNFEFWLSFVNERGIWQVWQGRDGYGWFLLAEGIKACQPYATLISLTLC